MKKILLFAVLLCAASAALGAQPLPQGPPGWEDLEKRARFGLSQNLADYLFLGTLNAGGETFSVTIFVSNKGSSYKIQQLKIEQQR